MTTEFVRLIRCMTVGQALKRIRAEAGEKETIYACYVLEPGDGAPAWGPSPPGIS